MSSARSAWLTGTLRHRRHQPRPHRFRYRVHHALIDLRDVDALDRDVRGFGLNRRALTTLYDVDHLGPVDRPILDKLATWVERAGGALPDGPVLLQTNLRVFGHTFNPVSWFWCFDTDGVLRQVVAEVNNTFGDSHSYLLDALEVDGNGLVTARATKALHVSPFLDISGLHYTFRFRPPRLDEDLRLLPGRVVVHMDVDHVAATASDPRPAAVARRGELADGTVFDATLVEDTRPFTSAQLLRLLVTQPLMPLRTVLLIHLQAIALFARRVGFWRRPTARPDGYERPTSGPATDGTTPTDVTTPDATTPDATTPDDRSRQGHRRTAA